MTEEERIYATTLNLIGTPAGAEVPVIQAAVEAEHKTALWHHLAAIMNALEQAGEDLYVNYYEITAESGSGHAIRWDGGAWIAD